MPLSLSKSPELPAKDLGFLGPAPEAQHWDCAGGEQIQGLCIWNQYLRLFVKKRGGREGEDAVTSFHPMYVRSTLEPPRGRL